MIFWHSGCEQLKSEAKAKYDHIVRTPDHVHVHVHAVRLETRMHGLQQYVAPTKHRKFKRKGFQY